MRFSVLVDVNVESLDDAVERLAVIKSVSTDAVLLVESADDLLLVGEMRQRGVNIKAACLGRLEKKLIAAVEPAHQAN